MKGIKIAKIFGISIELHWSWFLIFGYFFLDLRRERSAPISSQSIKSSLLYFWAGIDFAAVCFGSCSRACSFQSRSII